MAQAPEQTAVSPRCPAEAAKGLGTSTLCPMEAGGRDPRERAASGPIVTPAAPHPSRGLPRVVSARWIETVIPAGVYPRAKPDLEEIRPSYRRSFLHLLFTAPG